MYDKVIGVVTPIPSGVPWVTGVLPIAAVPILGWLGTKVGFGDPPQGGQVPLAVYVTPPPPPGSEAQS